MNILYVSYPLLPVSENSAGGAEQMLWTLEREMHARGHGTSVAACASSRVAGDLIATGYATQEADTFEQRDAEHCAATVEHILKRDASGQPYDLIHDKSGGFWRCASALRTPVLVTLHLPRHMYRSELFKDVSPDVSFNCVSQSQAETFRDLPRFLGVVPNGIAMERFPLREQKSDYLLWIGRMCEEKAPHIAIEVSRRAGLPLVMAGAVYPFSYHQQYFASQVARRLADVTYIDWPTFDEKLVLLQNARAVLLTSTVNETSSLVAMEAMACGTPAIAFRRGAFPEVIAEDVTGLLVDDAEQMVAAIERLAEIKAFRCRQRVEREFSATRMAQDYEGIYKRIVSESVRSTRKSKAS